ncbi:50S ribosomal protein L4 [bacterium]|nr:MAG: 50S ribosomal protein L4 [bacterium]RKZ24764.1 MAG: 50S ribosomal protein L4 [bacterium]
MEVKLLSLEGQEKKKIKLPEKLFGVKPHEGVVWEVIKMYMARKRQGTACAKTRGEVRGGGRKPWRQKHTGRARHGSIRAPQWRHGGVVHGPKPRDYNYSVPAKVKRLALYSALSHRASQGKVFVIEDIKLEEPRTRRVAEILKNIGVYGEKTLLLYGDYDPILYKSARNIENLTILEAHKANAYDVLRARNLVITESGLKKLEEVFG